jgi:hypothetical protein
MAVIWPNKTRPGFDPFLLSFRRGFQIKKILQNLITAFILSFALLTVGLVFQWGNWVNFLEGVMPHINSVDQLAINHQIKGRFKMYMT